MKSRLWTSIILKPPPVISKSLLTCLLSLCNQCFSPVTYFLEHTIRQENLWQQPTTSFMLYMYKLMNNKINLLSYWNHQELCHGTKS
ncbi:hypothetical protein GLYMA_06G149301v4 [Glycine max]|nr:hypothetical protein GLYMA_06G149301v4 [Glycine max]KAH1125982.1 hypothetical protein GYH30_015149 [Glycine max]